MFEKVSDSIELAPVGVTMIGTGDGTLQTGAVGTTVGRHQPNLLVTVVSPLVAIAVRFGNAYLTTLVALVGAGMVTDVIPATDFMALVVACAKLSLAGAGLGALKDCVTIFARLETKFPLASGSV